MVYVIKTESDPSYIKVGFCECAVNSRVQSIQTGCPFKLSVLYLLKGSRTLEKVLHGKLKAHRMHSQEWFKLNDETVAIIEANIEMFKVDDVVIKTPKKNKTGPRINQEMHNKIMKLRKKGVTVNKTAEILGIHRATVVRHGTNHKLNMAPKK